MAINRSKELKKDRDCIETDLLKQIDTLWKYQTLSQSQECELQLLQSKLDDLFVNKANRAFVHSRSYFLALEKGTQKNYYQH